MPVAGKSNGVDWTLPPQLQKYHAVSVGWAHDDFAVERPFAFAIFPQLRVCPGVEGSEAVLSGDENVGLSMMLDQDRRGMARADGAILLPDDPAGSFIQAHHITKTCVMVPRAENGVVQNP